MKCKTEIEKLLNILSSSRYSISELVSVLLVIKSMGPVGRVILSNILGIGDKKARNIIKELEKKGIIRVTRAGSTISEEFIDSINLIKCTTRGDYTISMLPCDIEEVSIIRLRDELILLLGAPEILIAIGYSQKDFIDFPGIPSQYKIEIIRLIHGFEPSDREAIAIFRKPYCYKCCSSFLQALITSARRSDTMSRSL